MAKHIISVKVCPGEPTDGSGKVCIHLFVSDPRGPFTEPHVLCIDAATKELTAKATRGRLACDHRRTVATSLRNGVTVVTPRTDDPRAVTCPKCLASVDCATATDLIAAREAGK